MLTVQSFVEGDSLLVQTGSVCLTQWSATRETTVVMAPMSFLHCAV